MAKIKDIGFIKNYQFLLEADVTPNGPERTFARVAGGIRSTSDSTEEETDSAAYYDSDGGTVDEVKSVKFAYEVTGDRLVGDPFQDFVVSRKYVSGNARKTTLRMTSPDGEVIEGTATISNIKGAGPNGEANSAPEFGCTLAFDGIPAHDAPTATTLPAEVAAEDVTVAVGAKAKLGESVSPETASGRCVYEVESWDVCTVDSEGNVTGVAEGATRVRVKAAAKPSVSKVVTVTVTGAQAARAAKAEAAAK